jgi:hypothetical protein
MATIAAAPPTPIRRSTGRTIARWMVSFAGFPLGGLAAIILTGPVDSTTSAIAGGLVTGVVLGAVQAWAMRADRRLLAAWVLATALGLAAGLAIGASVVSFSTGLGDLAIQGAISGLAVGLAQAIPLVSRVGPVALAWPVYLAGAWAAGWVVSTLIGVQVSERFTVFGAAGAVTVALLTGVLPVFLHIRQARTQESPS